MIAAKESIKRLKDTIRKITQRSRGVCLEKVILDLTTSLRGWAQYFRKDRRSKIFLEIDQWIRRKIRCYRLKQRKKCYSIARWLKERGISNQNAWNIGTSSKGWWRLAKTPVLNDAMDNQYLNKLGLMSLHKEMNCLNVQKKPPYATTHVRWCGRSVGISLPPTRSYVFM